MNVYTGYEPDIKYSLDNGETWTQWDYSAINLNDADEVCFKGLNIERFSKNFSQYHQFVFGGSGTIAASGNIMSLLDNGACKTRRLKTSCFCYLFKDCANLTLPPKLPATNLAQYCYYAMFKGCTSLTKAPELPATLLSSECYAFMFEDCSSLEEAPTLPALTLDSYCYDAMFRRCSNLNYIKCLATDVTASASHRNWVDGVSPTGTFVKAAGMNSWSTGKSGIPSGWTVVEA
jgi:hypothetical protein